MSFDHSALKDQLDGNIQYAGVDCTLTNRNGEFKAIITEESGGAQLGDHGFTETIEATATVSYEDFPSAPTFGRTLTVKSDGRRYRIGPSERDVSGWAVQLQALDRSTEPPDNQFPS